MCTAAPGRVVGARCVGGAGAGLELEQAGWQAQSGGPRLSAQPWRRRQPHVQTGGLPQRNPAPNLIPRLVLLPPDCPLSHS